jgi:hypothetical protein
MEKEQSTNQNNDQTLNGQTGQGGTANQNPRLGGGSTIGQSDMKGMSGFIGGFKASTTSNESKESK